MHDLLLYSQSTHNCGIIMSVQTRIKKLGKELKKMIQNVEKKQQKGIDATDYKLQLIIVDTNAELKLIMERQNKLTKLIAERLVEIGPNKTRTIDQKEDRINNNRLLNGINADISGLVRKNKTLALIAQARQQAPAQARPHSAQHIQYVINSRPNMNSGPKPGGGSESGSL